MRIKHGFELGRQRCMKCHSTRFKIAYRGLCQKCFVIWKKNNAEISAKKVAEN
ncbi:hypothetical protein ACFL35_09565 [Candidatus Riflebacteria bacterium]